MEALLEAIKDQPLALLAFGDVLADAGIAVAVGVHSLPLQRTLVLKAGRVVVRDGKVLD